MSKLKVSAVLLSLGLLINIAPLSVYAPAPVAAASTTTKTNTIKVQTVDVKMVFDGVNLQPPAGQYVFMYNNSTYVPLRFMSYALQKSVSWDAKNLKVTVAEPSSSELVVIKEFLMNASGNQAGSAAAKNITLNSIDASYVFGGSAKKLPAGQSSYILNGSVYVPLRYLSESVGNSISWDQKTKTITAVSAAVKEQEGKNNSGSDQPASTKSPTATTAPSATPAPTNAAAGNAGGSGGAGGGGTGSDKVSYESITSATEAKLNALKAESQSALFSTAMEYIAANDDAEKKKNIKAKGQEQLNSFKASFNSIIADAEQKLNSNGYSTAIISEYRNAFEETLKAGMAWAQGLAL
ncbi:stalk domain-containing protein [Paenibacillus sp. GCM10012306]|uniref:stalk domain-containing protein n=1 Tax=Paenibacillus sp. GCM10012306 TaxID=3317342 RepID=UPI00360A7E42